MALAKLVLYLDKQDGQYPLRRKRQTAAIEKLTQFKGRYPSSIFALEGDLIGSRNTKPRLHIGRLLLGERAGCEQTYTAAARRVSS